MLSTSILDDGETVTTQHTKKKEKEKKKMRAGYLSTCVCSTSHMTTTCLMIQNYTSENTEDNVISKKKTKLASAVFNGASNLETQRACICKDLITGKFGLIFCWSFFTATFVHMI